MVCRLGHAAVLIKGDLVGTQMVVLRGGEELHHLIHERLQRLQHRGGRHIDLAARPARFPVDRGERGDAREQSARMARQVYLCNDANGERVRLGLQRVRFTCPEGICTWELGMRR